MSSEDTISDSSISESSGGNTPKRKMEVIVEVDGSVVGEYSKQWNTRSGKFVRAHIPISYTDWRRVPNNFKDNVWKALMDEFELNVPPDVARPLMEKSWSQKFRTFKATLRAFLENDNPLEAKPKGIDPDIWREFVQNESDLKKKEQNIKNAENRKKSEISHCLGRRSYAQTQYILQGEPEKEMRRLEKWYVAHEHSDGTVVESARSKYAELKALEKKRKSTNKSGEDSSNIYGDLDTDELAQVFGKDTKGHIRAVGSHVSKKQLIHAGVAKAKCQQYKKANEEAASMKVEIISYVNSRLSDFEGMMHAVVRKLSNGKGRRRAVGSHISKKQLIHARVAKAKSRRYKKAHGVASLKDEIISQINSRLADFEGTMEAVLSLNKLSIEKESAPQMVNTSTNELGSNSVHHPHHLSRNLDNLFTAMGVSHPHSRPTPAEKPRVILMDKFGKELAVGYVVTDATARVCHSKPVGIGEKKVYVEEVIERNARLWDPPQGVHDTLEGYVQGGFLVWLECWLKYV